MPVHDWRRVEAGIFHDFHMAWAAELRRSLNEGLLPQGYYVLVEQHAGRSLPDVLTLHSSPEPLEPDWLPPDTGGIALAEAPPRVQRRQTVEQTLLARRRSLAIRHVSGHRLIALIEIISPGNKDRARHVDELVDKAASALERGIHVLLLDMFPPGPHDPSGIHVPCSKPCNRHPILTSCPPRAANSGQLRRRPAGRSLHRALRCRLPFAREAAVPPAGPLRERSAGADLSGRLPSTPAVWREVLESGDPQLPPAGGLPPHSGPCSARVS